MKTIKQTVFFDASPMDVYELLMDESKHSELTDSDVEMSNEVDGTFEVFDGYCHGINIEIVEGEKIVQFWHFEEDGWAEDHFSTCTFIFEPTEQGCKLDFTQTDVPDHTVEALENGWNQFYWEPMKEYLAENRR
jgi:activator of HSP90 ATPase